MTAAKFRQNAELVAGWRELLASNPVVAQVLVVLLDEKPSAVVAPNTDALERAATLARIEQHDFVYNLLRSLTENPPPVAEEEPMTWGAPKA